MLLLVGAALLAAPAAAATVDVWHLTDPHVDKWYVEGSDAEKCYCESSQACPRMKDCPVEAGTAAARAQPWGNSEGNCATPLNLFASALDFMKAKSGAAPLVYFTGDFSEAGTSYPCGDPDFKPTTPGLTEAQQQINDATASDFATVRSRFPDAKILGSLGNHDLAPGDLCTTGPDGQAWQLDNLTATWGVDLDLEIAALATLKRGGYYAVSPLPGLRVLSLNTNLWGNDNANLKNASSPASREALVQFAWLEAELKAAAEKKAAVHILGHIPPQTQNGRGSSSSRIIYEWMPGFYEKYVALVVEYRDVVRGTWMGHVHTEEWSIVRDCGADAARCDGAPVSMILPGPAMTEGWPARNPAVRLLKFDAETFELVDMETYITDLRRGNAAGGSAPLEWTLEHDFRKQFGMDGLAPADFEKLHARMADGGSAAWHAYQGRGDGAIYCSKYDSAGASFPPTYPCVACVGDCKSSFLTYLNGSFPFA